MKNRTPLWPVLVFAAIGIACLCCLTGESAVLKTEQAPSFDAAFAAARDCQLSAPAVPAHWNVPRIFRVPSTGSMRPILDSRHVTLIEGLPFEALKPGDIAVFLHVRGAAESVRWGPCSRYLMHEVVGVRKGRVLTSGLTSVSTPHPVGESFGVDQFVGVVRRSWRVNAR